MTIVPAPLVSLDEADNYAREHPCSGPWQLASTEQVESAVRFASLLVRSLPFRVEFDSIKDSLSVRAAVCEWAIEIVRDPSGLHSTGAVVSEKRVGDLTVKYRATGRDFVPSMVRTYLADVLPPGASVSIVPR